MGYRIIHGDCLSVMETLEDRSVDAVIADPPYCAGAISEARRVAASGQGLRSENLKRFGWFVGDNMGTAGLVWLLRAMAFESMRIVKPTGSLLVFCDWRMLTSLQPAIESAGLRYQDLIVWNKGSFGLGQGFRKQHELIMHFSYGSPAYYDSSVGNVITVPRVGDRHHQTEKPTDLIERLIRVVTPPGGVVLDPFAGSGSTIIAAIEAGYEAIGIERDATCIEIAKRRLDRPHAPVCLGASNMPLPLFANTED